jgi:hypothetical protein
MKRKQTVYRILLVFFTLIGLWEIPDLVKTASLSKNSYPFVYFSSTEKKFLLREHDGRQEPFHDDEGKTYTDHEYDTALPLLNFRQLTINGEMPDSINGIAIDPRLLRTKQINFRYSPIEKNTPEIGLYIMYESLPKKAKLESPGDVFRLKETIEFIDAETNTINHEKSERFRTAMQKAGYTFPARWTYGNLSIRKPYDEGYFSLDAAGKLYHIKMVNSRPFIRDTQLNDTIRPAFFSMLEPADKRFYGFLFDKKGHTYILEEKSGKYNPLPLDIAPINIDTDELMIIGNFLYWTVSVQTGSGKHHYALDAETLRQKRHLHLPAPINRWDRIAGRLFPVYLTFEDAGKHNEYIAPRLQFTSFGALWINALLAILSIFTFPGRSKKQKTAHSIYILIFGIAGTIAFAILETTYKSRNSKYI